MSKLHVSLIALLLAVAATIGVIAVSHTAKLGAANHASAAKTVAARTRQLDRFEASLRRALAHKPPKLPAIPAANAAGASAATPLAVAAAPAPAASAQPRVIYRRPAPIVVVRHTQHGDDGAESSSDESSTASALSGGGSDD